MSIKRRLAQLETGSAQSGDGLTMVRDNIDVLLGLYVATEIVWWPHRASLQSGKTVVAVHERRRKYRVAGVRWGGGGNAAGWKQAERKRASLASSGMITLTNHKGTPHVRLTDSALSIVRALIGLPGLDEGAKVLRVAASVLYDEKNPYCRVGGWVSEERLSFKSYADLPLTRDWYVMESLALPLLIAGALESTSSTVGHIYYRVAGQEPAYADGPDIAVDESLQDRYLDLWSLEPRLSWTPVDGNEVIHGLSATR